MGIAIGNDHRGVGAKQRLTALLAALGHELSDLGAEAGGSVDYPDYALPVAEAVAGGTADRGILICATGHGMCIAANKVPGIRAALTHDTYSAERAALSNNAQIITMGARVIGAEVAKTIADAWLAQTMNFDAGGKSAGNVDAIDAVDAKYSKT